MNAAATPTMAGALAPKSASGDDEQELSRKIRFMRTMDRGLKSVQFDSDAWFGALKATPDARTAAATRMLLAYAPQAEPDPASEPLAIVRQIVLDAAYQLK